nr:membrane protein insertion efficiency factor YidD [Desulfogranum mediterraneum]
MALFQRALPTAFRRLLPRLHRLPGQALILLFKGYQLVVSPLFPPSCRFIPTCSQYAIDAVQKYGLIRGGGMTLWRLLRCHPFSRGGYDPVK